MAMTPRRKNTGGHLLQLESDTALAAQAHFGLATIYRKEGKTAEAESEMEQFRKLQSKRGPNGRFAEVGERRR